MLPFLAVERVPAPAEHRFALASAVARQATGGTRRRLALGTLGPGGRDLAASLLQTAVRAG